MFRNLFNPDSDLMIFMTDLTDAIFLSLFWIMGCVLVVTAGPATAALYDASFRCFRKGERHSWERYLHSFRVNFKTGCLAAVPVLAVLALALEGIYRLFRGAYLGHFSWMLLSAGLVVSFVLLGILALVFPLLSRFETTVGQLLGNAFRLAMANLPRTLVLAALHAGCIYLCLRFVVPVFILPSLCMLASSYLVEPMLRPFLPEEEAEEPEASEPEETE